MAQDPHPISNPPHINSFSLEQDSSNISFSDQHATIYNFNLSIFSLLAYAYLLFFPGISIVLSWISWQQLQLVNGYLDYVLLASEIIATIITVRLSYHLFTLKFSFPKDKLITEEDAPYLHTLIKEIQLQENTPEIHRIYISHQYEAKIIRTAKSGFALNFHNSLVLGLPLIQSLSPAQLRTLIHRELLHITHLSHHYSGWFYYQRDIWYQFLFAHQQTWSINNIIISSFFSWYAPLYKLLSQAAARREQLYVDRQIHQQQHTDDLIDIITTMGISADFLYEEHIPHLLNKAYKHEFPPYFPYESFERNLHTRVDNKFSQRWLDKTLSQKNGEKDFPGIQERIFNLGLNTIWLPELKNERAATGLLGNALPLLLQQFDDAWFINIEHEWNSRFKVGQGEQNKLKEYQVLLKQNILADQKIWEYILLIKKYLEPDEAMALYKKILNANFTDPRISFDIGRTLLRSLDSDGIKAMQKTIELDTKYTIISYQLLTKFYSQMGDKKMAQSYRRKALEYQVEAA